MSLKDQSTLRVVLYEGSDAQALEAADRFTAMTALLERGFAVTRVASGGQVAPADRTSLLVLGRFNEGRVPRGEDADGLVNLRFQDITGFDSNRIEAGDILKAEVDQAIGILTARNAALVEPSQHEQRSAVGG